MSDWDDAEDAQDAPLPALGGRRGLPVSFGMSSELKKAADELYWCVRETYASDGSHVLKGGNNLVSFYVRPTAGDAELLASTLENAISGIRRRRAIELIAEMERLLIELKCGPL